MGPLLPAQLWLREPQVQNPWLRGPIVPSSLEFDTPVEGLGKSSMIVPLKAEPGTRSPPVPVAEAFRAVLGVTFPRSQASSCPRFLCVL